MRTMLSTRVSPDQTKGRYVFSMRIPLPAGDTVSAQATVCKCLERLLVNVTSGKPTLADGKVIIVLRVHPEESTPPQPHTQCHISTESGQRTSPRKYESNEHSLRMAKNITGSTSRPPLPRNLFLSAKIPLSSPTSLKRRSASPPRMASTTILQKPSRALCVFERPANAPAD